MPCYVSCYIPMHQHDVLAKSIVPDSCPPPPTNEPHHSVSSRCLMSITSSPLLTPASHTPPTPTSHLPLPSTLLYYPAGIALGTLQSCDSTPVTPSRRRAGGQWHLVKVEASFWGFVVEEKWKILKLLFMNVFLTVREKLVPGLVSYTHHQEEILIFYDYTLFYEPSCLLWSPTVEFIAGSQLQ